MGGAWEGGGGVEGLWGQDGRGAGEGVSAAVAEHS